MVAGGNVAFRKSVYQTGSLFPGALRVRASLGEPQQALPHQRFDAGRSASASCCLTVAPHLRSFTKRSPHLAFAKAEMAQRLKGLRARISSGR